MSASVDDPKLQSAATATLGQAISGNGSRHTQNSNADTLDELSKLRLRLADVEKEREALLEVNQKLQQHLAETDSAVNQTNNIVHLLKEEEEPRNIIFTTLNTQLTNTNDSLSNLAAEQKRLKLQPIKVPVSITLSENTGILGVSIVAAVREQQTLDVANANASSNESAKVAKEFIATSPNSNLSATTVDINPISTSLVSMTNANAANSVIPTFAKPAATSTGAELLINDLPCSVVQLQDTINAADRQLNEFFQIFDPAFSIGSASLSAPQELEFDEEEMSLTASGSANGGKISPDSPNDESILGIMLAKAKKMDLEVNLRYMALSNTGLKTSSIAPTKMSFFVKMRKTFALMDLNQIAKKEMHEKEKSMLLKANTALDAEIVPLKTEVENAIREKEDALKKIETNFMKGYEKGRKESAEALNSLGTLKLENESTIITLTQELQSLRTISDSLKNENETLRNNSKSNREAIESLNTKIDELERKRKAEQTSLTDKITEYTHQISVLIAEKTECETRLNRSNELLSAERNRNILLNTAMQTLQETTVQTAEKNKKRMDDWTVSLKQEFDQLSSKKVQAESELNHTITSLQSELKNQKQNLDSKNAATEILLRSTQKDLESTKAQLDLMKTEKEQADARVLQLQHDLRLARLPSGKGLAATSSSAAAAVSLLSPTSTAITSLTAAPSSSKPPFSASAPATTSELEEALANIQTLESDKKTLIDKINTLNAELQKKEKEKSHAIEKIETDFKKEISELKIKLNTKASSVDAEIKGYQDKIQNLSLEYDRLTKSDVDFKKEKLAEVALLEAQLAKVTAAHSSSTPAPVLLSGGPHAFATASSATMTATLPTASSSTTAAAAKK